MGSQPAGPGPVRGDARLIPTVPLVHTEDPSICLMIPTPPTGTPALRLILALNHPLDRRSGRAPAIGAPGAGRGRDPSRAGGEAAHSGGRSAIPH